MKRKLMSKEVIEGRRSILKDSGWDDWIQNHSRAKETKIIRKEM